jgi:hypothetical protein
MVWRGWDGRRLSIEQFKAHVEKMPVLSRVRQLTLHNTGAPNLAQLKRGARTLQEMQPVFDKRMASFENYYKNEKRWDGAPSLFFFPDGTIGLGTPLSAYPVHSPSYNGTSLAGEMCGSYEVGQDDDDAGEGLVVKDVAAKAFAVLMRHYGFEPQYKKNWFRHRDDTRTTHKCPGSDIDPAEFQARLVRHYEDLFEAGDIDHAEPVDATKTDDAHSGTVEAAPKPIKVGFVNVVQGDDLNLRDTSGTAGAIIEKLPKGTRLEILSEAENLGGKWFSVRTPSGKNGWVSSKFVVMDNGMPANMDHNDVAMAFLTGLPVQGQVWVKTPYSVTHAAALVGQFMRESYPRMMTGAIGDKGTAWGIGQWRNERQAAMRKLAKDMGREADDLVAQLAYAYHELQTTEKFWNVLLLRSTTMEQAVSAAIAYEKPRGWLRPKREDGSTRDDWPSVIAAGKKGDGFAERTNFANQMIKEYPDIEAKALAGKVN